MKAIIHRRLRCNGVELHPWRKWPVDIPDSLASDSYFKSAVDSGWIEVTQLAQAEPTKQSTKGKQS